MIHVQDVTQIIRCYKECKTNTPYEDKIPYDTVLTILFNSDEEAVLIGLHGTFTKDMYVDVWNYLYNRGIKRFKMERNGIEKIRILDRELIK